MSRYRSHEIHQYPEEALANALKAIREENLGIRAASRKYGVPRGTIQDRGRVSEGPRRMGPGTVLTKEEEDALENWLITLATCGFPQKKCDLLNTVEQIMKKEHRDTRFKDQRPGQKWYLSFRKRHPNLSLREAEGVTKGRSIITEGSIRKWFRHLKDYLEQNNTLGILNNASRIFNGDETSFAMCPKSGKVLAPKGYKNIYEVKKGNEKETLTVLLIFSVDGKTMPPMVVFPFIRPNKAIIDSMPSSWFLGRSETGWMKKKLPSQTYQNKIEEKAEEKVNTDCTLQPDLSIKTKIHVLQDITLKKSENDNDKKTTSLTFNKHLWFPAPIKSANTKVKRERFPSAISSSEFRIALQEKEKRKENKRKMALKEKEKKKENKLKRLAEKRVTSSRKKRRKKEIIQEETKTDSNKDAKEIKIKEKCAFCKLDMDSDTEENELKNIGCDKCPNWYHLKCTHFQGCNYCNIEDADFICDDCKDKK